MDGQVYKELSSSASVRGIRSSSSSSSVSGKSTAGRSLQTLASLKRKTKKAGSKTTGLDGDASVSLESEHLPLRRGI